MLAAEMMTLWLLHSNAPGITDVCLHAEDYVTDTGVTCCRMEGWVWPRLRLATNDQLVLSKNVIKNMVFWFFSTCAEDVSLMWYHCNSDWHTLRYTVDGTPLFVCDQAIF